MGRNLEEKLSYKILVILPKIIRPNRRILVEIPWLAKPARKMDSPLEKWI